MRLLNVIAIGYMVAATALVSSCATTSGEFSKVHIGMPRADVIQSLGTPNSIAAQGGAEYMNYYLCMEMCWALDRSLHVRGWHYVRIIDGKVESYGRPGDFDSTKTPTIRIEKDERIVQDVKVQGTDDMYVELKKLNELKEQGILTQEEFDERKRKILSK